MKTALIGLLTAMALTVTPAAAFALTGSASATQQASFQPCPLVEGCLRDAAQASQAAVDAVSGQVAAVSAAEASAAVLTADAQQVASAPAPSVGNRAFVDNDGDGVCDNYANGVCPGQGYMQNGGQGQPGRGSCGYGANYVDANGDGVCDNYANGASPRGGQGHGHGGHHGRGCW